MALFTPTNQKRLTNVSTVRLRRCGERYEIACYPNKVRAWRDKLETNLDEVLQSTAVFTNVSKGQLAKKKQMYDAFETADENAIIRRILTDGELQITEKERNAVQQALFRDVAKIVSEKCVNPENNRAYPVTMVEKMMRDCHISLRSNKSAKQHALEVMKKLRSAENFKIAPAMMEVMITVEKAAAPAVLQELLQLCDDVLRQEEINDAIEIAAALEPDKYGAMEMLLGRLIKGKYCIEVVGNACHASQKVRIDGASKSMHPPQETVVTCPDGASQLDTADVTNESPDIAATKVPVVRTVRGNKAKKGRKHGRKKADDDWPDDDK